MKKTFYLASVLFILGFLSFNLFAESNNASPVELTGDQVEYSTEGNKMIASGNVSIARGNTKLTADKVEFSRDSGVAMAEGRVVLTMPQGIIRGDKFTYDFNKMTGDFSQAKIALNIVTNNQDDAEDQGASPAPSTDSKTAAASSTSSDDSQDNFGGDMGIMDNMYGSGDSVKKVGDDHIVMENGYVTSCDLEKPHFRLASKKLDVYPSDKVVARNVRMFIGKVPIMYLPKYSQKLNDRPLVVFTPGYDKNWGAFLLQSWRYRLNEQVKGILHLDYRDRKGFAPGLDLFYTTKNMGAGSIRTYYMNEITPQRKNFWDDKSGKSVYAERFKAEWRHRWAIDETTDMTLQYYKLSDSAFLKDYFKREYREDINPASFFLLTKNLNNGTLSFRTDARVNRFTSIVERLPELRYDIANQELGDSGIYLKSQSGFTNLSWKDPSPTEVRRETMRFDSDNQLSYPFKVSFLELKPYVGSRQTYYSKTQDPSQYDVIRGIFETGASLSTKFYKVYDVQKKIWGIEISRLRHVVTPSVNYIFNTRPTISSAVLDDFDYVDSLDRSDTIELALENKWQTKGLKEGSVDILRFLLKTNFNLKDHPSKGGFDHVKSEIEFNPLKWLTFSSDSDYDTVQEKLNSANFDLYVSDSDKGKWAFNLGKRFSADVDDQITTGVEYMINPKWKFKTYRRFDVMNNIVKEQEYTLTRDLHCWEVDINFNETRNEGSEIWVVFRLKALPDLAFDLLGTSFNKRKAGSQVGP